MILSQQEGVDLKVFDCTAYPTPEEGDPIMNYKEKHIQGAEHLDLRYLRDMSKPYPFMLPSEKQFVDFILTGIVKRHESANRSDFIRRVVIDVQVRVGFPTSISPGDESF